VGRPTIGSTALTLYDTALFKLALGATRAYVPLDDTGHVDCLTVHMYTAQWRIPLREARDVRCGAASRQPERGEVGRGAVRHVVPRRRARSGSLSRERVHTCACTVQRSDDKAEQPTKGLCKTPKTPKRESYVCFSTDAKGREHTHACA